MQKKLFQALLIAAILCPNVAVAQSCSKIGVTCVNGQCPNPAPSISTPDFQGSNCMLVSTTPNCQYYCLSGKNAGQGLGCSCSDSQERLAPERRREVLQEMAD